MCVCVCGMICLYLPVCSVYSVAIIHHAAIQSWHIVLVDVVVSTECSILPLRCSSVRSLTNLAPGYSTTYSKLRPNSTKSRKLEYIQLVQNNLPRLSATEMALTGFNDKHILIGQVEEYNRRIQLPTFHIKGNFTSDVSFAFIIYLLHVWFVIPNFGC